ncbi:MAG: hypothetical protein ACI9BW_004775 [Gammaproteobacteria bacterium]|jgi:hypothetical protein
MGDTTNLAGAMAITILLVFLFRFYRRQIAPEMKRQKLPQILGGALVILSSIILSIWLRSKS